MPQEEKGQVCSDDMTTKIVVEHAHFSFPESGYAPKLLYLAWGPYTPEPPQSDPVRKWFYCKRRVNHSCQSYVGICTLRWTLMDAKKREITCMQLQGSSAIERWEC
jgi:hypothetical protein